MIGLLYKIFTLLLANGVQKLMAVISKKVQLRYAVLRKQQEELPLLTNRIIVHCASLGEFEMALPLINLLLIEKQKLLVSFTSPSGYTKAKLPPGVNAVYMPADSPKSMRLFFETLQPTAFVLIKYEFWLNMMERLNELKIPCFLISATLRKNHFLNKWYAKPWIKALNQFKYLGFQDESSVDIAKQIGLKKPQHSGDPRFNRVQSTAKNTEKNERIETFLNGKPALVLGSSWPEEEQLMAKIWPLDLVEKLLIAPHDISENHIEKIKALFPGSQLYTQENSEGNVLILNTIGELKYAYKYAQLAIIGGGFTGALHNILEALAWNVPVIFGPKHSKFWEAQAAIDAGFANTFCDASELKNILESFKIKPTAINHWLREQEVNLLGLSDIIQTEIKKT